MARREAAQYDVRFDARTPARPERTRSGRSSLASPLRERAKRREICVLGFRGVGKSSITVQFVERIFVETYYPTIENTFQKDVNFRGENISLQILDTTGQDELTIFSPRHMVGIHGYLLVYDVTSRQSFRVVQYIYEKILNAFLGDTSNRYIPIVLVGNKCDLDHDRKVSVEEGRRLASEWKCSFIECSAKHDENVKAAFNQLLLQVQENEAPMPVAEPGFFARCCWCCAGGDDESCCGGALEGSDDVMEDDFGWRKDGRGSHSSSTWDGRKNMLVHGDSKGGRWSRNRDHSIQTDDGYESPSSSCWWCCCCGGGGGAVGSDGRGSGDMIQEGLLRNRQRLSSNDVNSTCTVCRLSSDKRPCLRAAVLLLSTLMVLIGVGSAITGFQIAAREASTHSIIPAHHGNSSNTTSPSPPSASGKLSNVPWTRRRMPTCRVQSLLTVPSGSASTQSSCQQSVECMALSERAKTCCGCSDVRLA